MQHDHGHPAMIEASYGYLRQFTPDMLTVLAFADGPCAASLLEAVDVLRQLKRQRGAHRSGGRRDRVRAHPPITVDTDAELAQLDPKGHRPLRQAPHARPP